ncbi:MAG: hydantoinase/oxoprolinase family protein [Gemmatimonadota bacterium]|nr:hydantoinase/oxoprolinase family protein [Gemmatimonadota bacterium]
MSEPMSPHAPTASTALLAVDTGGTFTDLVLLREGRIETLKVFSTPGDPAQAVLDGIAEILGADEPFALLHGSTVATNALLERRGSKVVLVTNRGFEDVIEIGRQNRPQLYALVGHRLPPLVERDDRLGIAGRLGPRGEVIEALDESELGGLTDLIVGKGAEAVAISLLHSYANPDHEEAVARAVEATGLPVSVSSRLVPEFREYERTSTTVVNAFVAPVMDRYLGRLSREAGADRVTIMGSNGGALPVERARREPVHTVLSGPAGGVVGALTWARRSGHERVISFDMGGTSTDVSLCPGKPLRTREFEIAGQPTAIPVLDIHTVGAGGGSLARVDAGGALRVGPQSAGAQPGPICYGRGGSGVTVTDAHVWLGRLPADAFLGGGTALDREAIRRPLEAIAARLGTDMEEAAEGILEVADTAMERALRVISVERGYDPAEFAVVAFGGAGGLHVAELTHRLGAVKAIVPPDPGLLSAYGMLASPVSRETSRTVLLSTDDVETQSAIDATLTELERRARSEMLDEGADDADLTVELWVDARYVGQSFELRVPAHEWTRHFHEAHEERYGHRREAAAVEAVTLRAMVTAPPPSVHVSTLPPAGRAIASEPTPVTYLGERLGASRVWRHDLENGHEFVGPFVVQEYSGTTWIPPGWHVQVDAWGCLHLTPPA